MKRLFCFVMLCMFGLGVLMVGTKVNAQELREYTAHISDPEFRGIIEESMGSILENRATSRSFSVTVPSGKRYTSGYFQVYAGKYITISATLSKSAKIGIIDADGLVRYVTGTSINHTFSITKTNAYCTFIQNLNSTSITAKGSYAWN